MWLLKLPSGCPLAELKSESNNGFGVYIVCRTADALQQFVRSNVSRQLSQLLETVFSRLIREKIVVVQLDWIQDYQRCARNFIETTRGV